MEISREIALELLSLEDPFSKDDLKERYRSLAKLLHPDVKGDNTLFLLINNCYNYLLDNNSGSKTQKPNTKQKQDEKKQPSQPQNYYVALYDLYGNLSYYKDICKDNIIEIRTDINILIKPIFSSKQHNLSIQLFSDYKSFLSNNFVIFEKQLTLPEDFKKYSLFKVEFILLGKVYKKKFYLGDEKDCRRLLIKHKGSYIFNSFIDLRLHKK